MADSFIHYRYLIPVTRILAKCLSDHFTPDFTFAPQPNIQKRIREHAQIQERGEQEMYAFKSEIRSVLVELIELEIFVHVVESVGSCCLHHTPQLPGHRVVLH